VIEAGAPLQRSMICARSAAPSIWCSDSRRSGSAVTEASSAA
jgi:hypothetical protein